MTDKQKYLLHIKDWIAFSILCFAIILFVFSPQYLECAISGVGVWFFSVFPALFPYLFLANLTTKTKAFYLISSTLSPLTKKLFNTSELCGYTFFLNVIFGYPVGIKTIVTLKNEGLINQTETERTSAYCSSQSPVFLITCVGIMAKNALFGLLLFASQLISTIIVGIIFSFYKRKNKPSSFSHFANTTPCDNVLTDSASTSINSSLIVCGFLVLFHVLAKMLCDLKIIPALCFVVNAILHNKNVSNGIVFGLVESTLGLKQLLAGGNFFFALPTACAICGFGGLSMIIQSVYYLKSAKIKTAPFLIGKVITAFTSFLFGLIFSFIFGFATIGS